MKRLLRCTLGLLLTLCLAPTPPTASQQVSSTSDRYILVPIPLSPERHAQQAAPHIRNWNGTSLNWSGYAVPTAAGAVNAAYGSWTVTAVSQSQSANTYSSTWVGIDGYNSGTVEQTGTESNSSPSGPVYYAWFEMYPQGAWRISNFPVVPGDTITASVVYIGGSKFTLTIKNVTKAKTFTTTRSLGSTKRSSAEWIVEAPWSGGVLPLANFGTETFTACGAKVGSFTRTIGAFPNDPMTMQTSSGVVKAQPSALSSDGSSFSVSWYHE